MAGDESKQQTAAADRSEPAFESDFGTAAGLSRGERTVVQRLSEVLRFTDFMTLMMVLATIFSAFATWRTATVTKLLFAVGERPYMGVEQIAIDGIDNGFARIVVDCRNFGHVSATGGVARVGVTIDGKPLPQQNALADTENIGIVSPSVPHRIFRFVPEDIFEAVREGRSRMTAHVLFNYRGPDDRQFCYSEMMSYDRRSASFVPVGGDDQCSGQVF